MSQGKLTFKTTKQKRQASVKNVNFPVVSNEKLETLKSSDVQSPGSKRKYVSSPESSSPVSQPPPTGHSRTKRQEKRVRHTRTSHTACKTLFDYINTDKAEAAEPKQSKLLKEDNVKPVSVPTPPHTIKQEAASVADTRCEVTESEGASEGSPEGVPEGVTSEDKATQNDTNMTAKSFLKKIALPREEPAKVRPTYKTTGGKMLAAALAKKKEGVPAHKNEVIRALAARRELCGSTTGIIKTEVTSGAKSRDNPVPAGDTPKPTAPKLSARERFAHLIKPTSPKIKPFKVVTISSPTKSPLKEQLQPCLTLPETYKRLNDKFNTSDQVVNLLARRQETCTFQKLQRNVQEICRKRFTELDLGHVTGVYDTAYILAQCKGLSQIKNDRTVRNEYQLTIAFNYAETEDIKRSETTDIFGLHPTIKTNRKIDFGGADSNKISENEKITHNLAKEKHAFNQRGLLTSELLERSKRFQRKLLKYVRGAHQIFLSTLVPPLKIDDAKLTRWHPEFDLNGLELPPAGELPKPPVSSRLLSATEMLEYIDSNKATPPPGMEAAVNKNLQKVLTEKKEQLDKKKEEQLKDIDPALVARIKAKEAKRIAQKMTRDPEKDKELAMIERLDPLVRCLRVLYVSAGKGSLLLSEVTQNIASNPRITMSPPFVEEHLRLLIQICPEWLSMASIRKKQYLKLNRNTDTNIVLDAVKNKQNQLMS